jgi:hypothetical protein
MATGLDELCDVLKADWNEDCSLADGADMPILSIAAARIGELEGHNEELQSLDGLQQLRIEQLEAERDAMLELYAERRWDKLPNPQRIAAAKEVLATHLKKQKKK